MEFNVEEFNNSIINTWGNTTYKGKAIIKTTDKLDYPNIISSIIKKMKTKK